jgi:hypothetical protein
LGINKRTVQLIEKGALNLPKKVVLAETNFFPSGEVIIFYNGEFDPGSG